MKRSLLLLLFLSGQAYGSTYAFIGGTQTNAVTGRYYNVDDFEGGSTSEAAHALYVTTATTLTNLYAWTPDPGPTGGWSVAVYVDGVVTAQSVSNGDGETYKLDTDDVSVGADSRVDVKITGTGTPNAGRIKWAITYTSDVQYLGGYTLSLLTSTRYLNLKGSASTTSTVTRFVYPFAATAGHLHCNLSVAPGDGATRTFTIQKGGIDTAATIVYGAADSGIKSDDADGVACVGGNDLRLSCTATGTPAAANLTFWLDSTPDTAANFVLSSGSYATSSVLSDSAENYMSANGDLENPTATIADVDLCAPAMTVTAIYAILNAAPDNGAGTQQFTVALFEEDVASALSMVIAEAATTGNDTGSVEIALGNKIAYGFTPSGTPIATEVPRGVSICANIDEPAATNGAASIWNLLN
jgi:hypothetical protein